MKKFNLLLRTCICPAYVMLLVLILAASGSAFTGNGSGTGGDPYQITTCAQLQEMSAAQTASYLVMNNINCTGTLGTYGFVPQTLVNGTLDGGNFNISGVKIIFNATGTNGGFLISTNNAVVKNVHLIGINYTNPGYSRTNVGGLIGRMDYGSVINCSTTGSIDINGGGIGGIIGLLEGGLINETYSLTNIKATSGKIGGLIGDAGTMSGTTIQNSFAHGIINCTGYAQYGCGGLIGYYPTQPTLSYSYSTGPIYLLAGGAAGGFIGNAFSGSQVANSYWDMNRSLYTTTSFNKSTGKTTAQMQTQANFTGWDFTNTWEMCPSPYEQYPRLQGQPDGCLCIPNWVCSSFGTCNGTYKACLGVNDQNTCGVPFSGSLSDYNRFCTTVPVGSVILLNDTAETGLITDIWDLQGGTQTNYSVVNPYDGAHSILLNGSPYYATRTINTTDMATIHFESLIYDANLSASEWGAIYMENALGNAWVELFYLNTSFFGGASYWDWGDYMGYWQSTNISRSVGWHKLELEANETDFIRKVDGQVVFSESNESGQWHDILFGQDVVFMLELGDAYPTHYDNVLVWGILACQPDWTCSGYESCQPDDLRHCTNVSDNNLCGDPYAGNYSEFSPLSCDYCTPVWHCEAYGACTLNDTKYCIESEDTMNCYNQTLLPSDQYTGDYSEFGPEACDYCVPDWECITYETCQIDNLQHCTGVNDSQNCYAQSNISAHLYSGNYSEFGPLACEYCRPGWFCSAYGDCQPNNVKYCTGATDYNVCNITYTGNYSEFSGELCGGTQQGGGGGTYTPITTSTPPTGLQALLVPTFAELTTQQKTILIIIALLLVYLLFFRRK